MARSRTPTNVLELRGSFKKHPERKRDREPEGKGSFPKKAPAWFSDAEREAWAAVVKSAPVGVLTGSDAIHVEMTSQMLAEYRENPRKFTVQNKRLLSVLLGRLGLNPSDRAHVVVPKHGDPDEFEGL